MEFEPLVVLVPVALEACRGLVVCRAVAAVVVCRVLAVVCKAPVVLVARTPGTQEAREYGPFPGFGEEAREVALRVLEQKLGWRLVDS